MVYKEKLKELTEEATVTKRKDTKENFEVEFPLILAKRDDLEVLPHEKLSKQV